MRQFFQIFSFANFYYIDREIKLLEIYLFLEIIMSKNKKNQILGTDNLYHIFNVCLIKQEQRYGRRSHL